MLGATTPVVQSVAFWQTLLVACIPIGIALCTWLAYWVRHRSTDRREEDRREDYIWGYRDGNGIWHEGVLEAHTRQIKEVNERLDKAGLDR